MQFDVFGVQFVAGHAVPPPAGNQAVVGTGDNGYADAGGGGLFGGFGGMLWIWVLMLVAFWFFMFRPQRKREKAAREMQNSLRTGESIITSSGFYGKIVGVGTDALLIEFGENRGIRVWVRKSDIAGIKTPMMTPPAARNDTEKPEKIEDKS